jgi:hypothetical protein
MQKPHKSQTIAPGNRAEVALSVNSPMTVASTSSLANNFKEYRYSPEALPAPYALELQKSNFGIDSPAGFKGLSNPWTPVSSLISPTAEEGFRRRNP